MNVVKNNAKMKAERNDLFHKLKKTFAKKEQTIKEN